MQKKHLDKINLELERQIEELEGMENALDKMHSI